MAEDNNQSINAPMKKPRNPKKEKREKIGVDGAAI